MLFQQSSSSYALSSHLSTISKTYLLTPWSRVLLEKLTSVQLVKKFPTFYGTRRFITAFTSACHLSLYWASSIFCNKIQFYGEELLATRPTPKLEDHPLSAVRDCLFNIFAATLHTGGRSSIHKLRMRHAVVTGTHLSLTSETNDLKLRNCMTEWLTLTHNSSTCILRDLPWMAVTHLLLKDIFSVKETFRSLSWSWKPEIVTGMTIKEALAFTPIQAIHVAVSILPCSHALFLSNRLFNLGITPSFSFSNPSITLNLRSSCHSQTF